MLTCQWSGEGEREISGTPVRRMNKVHLFIPSSFIRCHRLKTGLFKNTAHLRLPASNSLSLCFSHAYEHKNKHTLSQRKWSKICLKAANTTMQTVCKMPFQQNNRRPASSSLEISWSYIYLKHTVFTGMRMYSYIQHIVVKDLYIPYLKKQQNTRFFVI